ncbi:MAG: tetratricopeptide repeat protein [Litorimonas sp.]
MKNFVLGLALIGTAISAPTYAQQSSEAEEVQSADVPDEVIATARKQTDPAMSAFLSGDYETAEIEFDKNAFCALRVERNFRAGVEGARDASIRSTLAGNIDTPQQTTGGPGAGAGAGAAAGAGPTAVSINGVNSSDFQTSNKRRTCEDRGFQVYMKGLSQLELGKTAEAKKTLSQATKIHRTLYDAHFKLSLLEYQEGNLDAAQKQLKKLRKIAARCKRCAAKPEIEGQVKYLDTLLN